MKMFATKLETLENDSTGALAIPHGNENAGGFVRNMFRKDFTKSVQEASDEYEEECIKRKHVVERIVLENICEIHWIYGFIG